ncbi:hypothetical protein KEM48_006846 [Puccinia striiformis f. sp. tritici PST-130]|nr:hypothetical protein KEM48_006846 [Puccinia striiformis f. sp. tritici PST-130]
MKFKTGLEIIAANEAAQAEKIKLQEIQRLKQVRPAGKLYGRSLIDELNSRKGNQKSKQIYKSTWFRISMTEAVPQVRVTLPHSSSSPMHLANQALQNTQSKFSQALINSSNARKRQKKGVPVEEEVNVRNQDKQLQIKDQINHRISRFDNWDNLLERESQPPPNPNATPEARAPIPLPVLLSPLDQSVNSVGSMDLDDNEEEEELVGFGNADTLARKLELQVEGMKYKPLPNLFESHDMVRPNSVQSQAALLSLGLESSCNRKCINGRGEEHLLNIYNDNNNVESILQSQEEQEDDNLPLSYRSRKSTNLKVEEEEDNRPLSHIGTKRMMMSQSSAHLTTSAVRSSPSSNDDSDEELPLGPIGSVGSDDSDMVPLGLRASTFLSMPTIHPMDMNSSNDDDVPLAYRASMMPRGSQSGQFQSSPQLRDPHLNYKDGSLGLDEMRTEAGKQKKKENESSNFKFPASPVKEEQEVLPIQKRFPTTIREPIPKSNLVNNDDDVPLESERKLKEAQAKAELETLISTSTSNSLNPLLAPSSGDLVVDNDDGGTMEILLVEEERQEKQQDQSQFMINKKKKRNSDNEKKKDQKIQSQKMIFH